MVADGLSVSADAKQAVDSIPEETAVLTALDTLLELTRRQRTLLKTAIDAGDYELPVT